MKKDWLPLDVICNGILPPGLVKRAREETIPPFVVFQYALFREEGDFSKSLPGPEVESFSSDIGCKIGAFYLQGESLFGYIDLRRGDDEYDHLDSSVSGLASKLNSEGFLIVANLPSSHIEPLPYNRGEDLIVLRNLDSEQIRNLQDAGIYVAEIYASY